VRRRGRQWCPPRCPDVLQAAEELAELLGVPAQARWGMSPFGGDTTDPIWRTLNASPFLAGGQTALLRARSALGSAAP
jgi:pyridoxine 4-dehydrogenase